MHHSSDSIKTCAAETAMDLAPLYRHAGKDGPECVLENYPRTAYIVRAFKLLIDVILPGRMTPIQADDLHADKRFERYLQEAFDCLQPEIERAIPFRWIGATAIMDGASSQADPHSESLRAIEAFSKRLTHVRKLVIEDIKAAYEGDPAALTYAEVQLAYPGLLAVVSHRLAHELYLLDIPIVPRVMSEWTHSLTGVDINPGATIGHGFFIDHATGVVIGETCQIGNRVKIYQGVTLGAKSFPLDENGQPIKHIKRHPTVEDNVVIYANATILGGETVIGKNSTIGGNVFITESVPPNSLVASKHPELHIKTESGDNNPDHQAIS